MKITIHYTFWLLVFVFLFSGLYWELVLFFAIIGLHEAGHLLFCWLFCQKVKKLNITAIGGLMEVEIRNLSMIKELIIYLSGIIINLLIMGLSRYLNDTYYRKLLYNYNYLVVIFNLLPIYPLDGYKVAELFLAKIINRPFREQKILFLISNIALGGFSYFLIKNKSIAFLILLIYLFYRNLVYHSYNSQIALKKFIVRYKGSLTSWQ
ncbi:MAG: hypothetical protein M0R05_04175 [Bacilli bacterium]|nr:hypothetical protein [Bacilli bacterium]